MLDYRPLRVNRNPRTPVFDYRTCAVKHPLVTLDLGDELALNFQRWQRGFRSLRAPPC